MTLIYLVAGETSGDILGGRLMSALRRRLPEVRFAGVGGPQMAAQGMRPLFPMDELAVMGLLEVLPSLPRVRRRFAEAVADVSARRPAAVVTIDSPGFTLRLLRAIDRLQIPRAHYVAPQVWAWRENRVRHFPGLWERLLCLLPFEPSFFARHQLPASFVGHPVLESGADRGIGERFRAVHGLAPEARVLTLMPGSRRGEISRLLPIYGGVLTLLQQRFPDLVPVVAAAPAVAAAVAEAASAWPVRPLVVTGMADKHDGFAASAAALTKSGTSTLELALAGVPMVVAYRTGPVTAAIVRQLVKIKYASIANLLAGHELVPELLQENCTAERLAGAVSTLLSDRGAAEAQRAGLRGVIAALAPGGGMLPSETAADLVLDMLQQSGGVQPRA